MTVHTASDRPGAAASDIGLDPRRVAILAAIGAALWLAAALFIRWAGPMGAFRGAWVFVVYAAAIPATLPAIPMGRRAAGLPRDRVLAAVCVMCASALFLDGIALAGFRSLYGSDPAVILGGAAWILWGVGVALALGLAAQRRL
jgi:hypothetical protein